VHVLSSTRRRLSLPTLVAALALTAACGSAPERDTSSSGEGSGSGTDAATATSVEDFGGMDALVEAAQEEGTLNAIALPPDWANYGELISTFEEKYDITVESAQPDASSQDEINAANQLRGTDRAPDVFDLGPAVATANTDLFAPYKVQTWDDIPDDLKDADVIIEAVFETMEVKEGVFKQLDAVIHRLGYGVLMSKNYIFTPVVNADVADKSFPAIFFC